jgi:hypothetical protein
VNELSTLCVNFASPTSEDTAAQVICTTDGVASDAARSAPLPHPFLVRGEITRRRGGSAPLPLRCHCHTRCRAAPGEQCAAALSVSDLERCSSIAEGAPVHALPTAAFMAGAVRTPGFRVGLVRGGAPLATSCSRVVGCDTGALPACLRLTPLQTQLLHIWLPPFAAAQFDA